MTDNPQYDPTVWKEHLGAKVSFIDPDHYPPEWLEGYVLNFSYLVPDSAVLPFLHIVSDGTERQFPLNQHTQGNIFILKEAPQNHP